MRRTAFTPRRRAASLLTGVVLLVAGCASTADSAGSSAAVPAATGATVAAPSSALPADSAAPTSVPGTAASDTAAPAALAAWQEASYTSVDGATSTIDDHRGKPVYVEFFATWCPTCLYQLRRVAEAAATDPDAVFLALSIETDVDIAAVAKYQATASLDGIEFGLVSAEMLAALAEGLGNSVVNPPATPHVVIDSNGVAGELQTGESDADAILAELTTVG